MQNLFNIWLYKKRKERTTQNTKQRYSYNIYCRRITIPSHKFRLHTHTYTRRQICARQSVRIVIVSTIRYITFSHSSNRIRNRKHSHLDFEGNACEFLFLPPSCCRRNFDVSARAGMATILEK